jgi:hypothetical protein
LVAAEIWVAPTHVVLAVVHHFNNDEIKLLNFDFVLMNRPTSSGMSSTV